MTGWTDPVTGPAYAEVARAASARGELVLRERHDPGSDGALPVLELRVNGVFVMDTAETGSEEELARRALELVLDPRTVLVGGLGLGFTAHALLDDPRVERVDVVEIEPALVAWMRDGTVPHGPALLADRRLHVVEADVLAAVEEAGPATYDLVLLDVDNGPDQLVHEGNARVYGPDFLTRVRRLLTPGGALVVWSAHPAPTLHARLTEVFGTAGAGGAGGAGGPGGAGGVEEIPWPVLLQSRPTHYYLYLARP